MDLSLIGRLEGPNLALRLIQPSDAGYVQKLRTDPTYNSHLSEVRGTVEDQLSWIKEYKVRENEGSEFYYVIERKDGTRCGLVRLYDIGCERLTWGSWILDANKPRKAALESAILSFGVGFDLLDLPEAFVDVRMDNKKALAFYIRLGKKELCRDERNVYFVYRREKFEVDRCRLLRVVEQEAQV